LSGAGADDEIVGAKMPNQTRGVEGTVLSVGVRDQDENTGRMPDAGLDGGAVALVVRMADDAGAGRRGALSRLVRRTVVDDKDLLPARS
jgi:hypothetical protein